MDKKLVYILLIILFVGCIALGIYTYSIERTVKDLNSDISNTANYSEKVDELEKSIEEKNKLIEEKDAKIEEINSALNNLTTENTNLKTEIETLKAQIVPQAPIVEVPPDNGGIIQ